MASPYARMTDWLDWQRPYRLGALLVLPPERVREEVNELRARYDPRSQAIAEAHVSLMVAPLTSNCNAYSRRINVNSDNITVSPNHLKRVS